PQDFVYYQGGQATTTIDQTTLAQFNSLVDALNSKYPIVHFAQVTSSSNPPPPPPDTQKPSIAITSPSAGQSLSRGSTITVSGTASDNVAVSSVTVQAGSGAIVQATSSNGYSTWTATVVLPSKANSHLAITAIAKDPSGNQQQATGCGRSGETNGAFSPCKLC